MSHLERLVFELSLKFISRKVEKLKGIFRKRAKPGFFQRSQDVGEVYLCEHAHACTFAQNTIETVLALVTRSYLQILWVNI